MATATDARATQILTSWFSPAYPVGAFAYSHGLEQVIADGVVHDAVSLETWISAILERGAGWCDAVLMARAMEAEADLDTIDDMALALASSAERARETREMGAAFVRVTAEVWETPSTKRAYPVAVGEAAAALNLPVAMVVGFYLHGFAANLVSVAVRIVPLGQTDGQRVMAALLPRIDALADAACAADLSALGTSVQAADIAAMNHETKPVRLFRT